MISEGSIVVAQLPQADGEIKLRPVLLLSELPGFSDFLACGISTQIRHAIPNFDLIVNETDAGFTATGLRATSVIRLNFISTIPQSRMTRHLGSISREDLLSLQDNLANHLRS